MSGFLLCVDTICLKFQRKSRFIAKEAPFWLCLYCFKIVGGKDIKTACSVSLFVIILSPSNVAAVVHKTPAPASLAWPSDFSLQDWRWEWSGDMICTSGVWNIKYHNQLFNLWENVQTGLAWRQDFWCSASSLPKNNKIYFMEVNFLLNYYFFTKQAEITDFFFFWRRFACFERKMETTLTNTRRTCKMYS